MTETGSGDFGTTRQAAIDALCEHFANDALSVEEFEERVDQAHKADSTEDLRKLLADLPSGDLPVRQEEASTGLTQPAQATVHPSRVKERGFMVAVLGGTNRAGRWIPARKNYSFAVMGGMALDFREALLPPGDTELWVFTIMGGAEIIVPPGLAVESNGVAILGGFEHRDDAVLAPDPNAPILRIRGVTIMGGVDVSVRNPGETSRDAKRRRRFERKEERRLEKERRRLERGE